MDASDILKLYDYHYWATRRILTASLNLSSEKFLAPRTFGLCRSNRLTQVRFMRVFAHPGS
jgi:hypothetical protein